jgi:HPt (histidine-containing phosphotransfer) domain-containing protein
MFDFKRFSAGLRAAATETASTPVPRSGGRGNAARAAALSSRRQGASPRTAADLSWLGGSFPGFEALAPASDSAGRAGPTSARAAEHAARSGTRRTAPTPVETAASLLAPLRETTRAAHGSSREARAASVAAAEQLARLVEGQPPEVQAALLSGAEAEIAQLTRQVRHLSSDETDDAIAALSRVANSVGSDNVRLLTDTMARELPDALSGAARRGTNREERVLDAMQDAIEGGEGALLATAMARSLADDGHAGLSAGVRERAGEAVANVRERYDEARAAVDARNAELAVMQTTWGATLDEDARAAGMESFLSHHEDDYSELDDVSAVLASTLEGASYGITAPVGFDGDDQDSAFSSALAAVPHLARTEAGSAVIVDAMGRSAAGRGSFLDVQRDRLDRGAALVNRMLDGLPLLDGAAVEGGSRLDTALLEATAVQTDVAARQGDLGALDRMLGQFASFTEDRDLARTAREIQDGIAEEWAEYEAGGGIIGGLDAMGSLGSLQSKIGKVFTETSKRYLDGRPELQGRFEGIGLSFTMGSTLSAYAALAEDPDLDSFLAAGGATAGAFDARNRRQDPDFEGPRRLGRVAAGAGLLGSGINSIQNPGSVRAHLETVVDTAGYASAAQMLSTKTLFGQAAKKAGLVAGVVFSAWDTFDALQRGDTYGAAASAAPLAGMAVGAMVGGPAGAAVGLVVGGVIGVGMELWRAWRRKDPILEFEQRTQPFLQGAFESMGMSEGDADQLSHRFRDVNDDLIGVGPVLAGLAGELDVEPEAVLRWAGDLTDAQVHALAKLLLKVDHEGERLWEQTGRDPGHGRDPRDPLDIALDRGRLREIAEGIAESHPDGPWA